VDNPKANRTTNHLVIDGSCNMRDLGGYPAQDGFTRWRVFIRAGNLDQLSLTGRQQLLDYGVYTIIDVRDEWEAQNFPNPFVDATAVTYLNLPLIGNRLSGDADWKTASEQYTRLHELYITYLTHCQPQIRAIIAAIADSRPATIIYCHAGKDRTGLVTALLLGAVGVPIPVIAEDYAETNRHIRPLVARWREDALRQGHDMQRFEIDVAAAAETIISMLAHLQARYGGVTNYLLQCGVTAHQLGQLLTRFVV
jgi:protein-tyrosine phosphatase